MVYINNNYMFKCGGKYKNCKLQADNKIVHIHRRCDMCTLRKLRGVLWLTRNLIQCSHRIQRLRMQVMCSSESTKVFQTGYFLYPSIIF